MALTRWELGSNVKWWTWNAFYVNLIVLLKLPNHVFDLLDRVAPSSSDTKYMSSRHGKLGFSCLICSSACWLLGHGHKMSAPTFRVYCKFFCVALLPWPFLMIFCSFSLDFGPKPLLLLKTLIPSLLCKYEWIKYQIPQNVLEIAGFSYKTTVEISAKKHLSLWQMHAWEKTRWAKWRWMANS